MKINLKKIIKTKPFLLAPMDAATDIGFRELCEENKASYTTTELTSTEALIRDKVPKYRYEKSNLKINCIQLFGSNPQSFKNALPTIEDEADIIDINFGCPSPSLTKNNSGSELLKNPKLIGEIVSTVVNNTKKPVTAKIRIGYDKNDSLKITKQIEDAGADLITIHGKTTKQKYSGETDWTAIKNTFEKTNIPLVGNGNIKEEKQIDKYLNSHCDALMIGRAAMGNPFIFEQFNYYKKNKSILQFDKKEKQKELFFKYLKKIENIPFYNRTIKIRMQAVWFFKGILGSRNLRCNIMKTKDVDEIVDLIKKF